MSNAQGWLLGEAPAVKFPEIGTTVEMEILSEPTLVQVRDFESGELQTWDDGTPKMQAVCEVQTNLTDDEIPDDDGVRRLFIGGGNMRAAIRKAVREGGGKELSVGDTLTLTYTGDDKPKKRGMAGAKMYEATYNPGA